MMDEAICKVFFPSKSNIINVVRIWVWPDGPGSQSDLPLAAAWTAYNTKRSNWLLMFDLSRRPLNHQEAEQNSREEISHCQMYIVATNSLFRAKNISKEHL